MLDAKPVSTLLFAHFKLSSQLCSRSNEKSEYMSKVPYANAVRCLMYLMVCTRPDEESEYMSKVPYVIITLGGHELCQAKSLNFIFL